MTRLFCVISLGIMVLGCRPTQDDAPTPTQTNQETDSGTTAAPSNADGGVLPSSPTDGGGNIHPNEMQDRCQTTAKMQARTMKPLHR